MLCVLTRCSTMISKDGDRQHVEHIFEIKDSKCLSVLFFFICNDKNKPH